MSHTTITFVVLAAVVVVFVLDRLPVAIVALGTALVLWATGVLPLSTALAGFGDPVVIFIAALFVVSESLDASGVTAWAGQLLIARVGESRTRLVVSMIGLVAVVTALISVNGAVAALLPVMVVTAVRLHRPPSQLMIPLAFGAHAGSLLALTGSPVNVVASEYAHDHAGGSFGYFSFALVGIPLVVGTTALVLVFGERLLPHRTPRALSKDFSDHARTLVEQYGLADGGGVLTRSSGLAEVVIPPRSALVGDIAFPGMVTEGGDLVVVAVQRKGEDLPGETALAVGDTLLLRGSWGALEHHLDDPEVLVVDRPSLVRRQAVPLGPGAKRTLVIVGAMVVLLATGAVPPAVAGLLAAGALVVTRVLTIEAAYRGISWTTVILVAGMISLSTAMTETGAAARLADTLVRVVGDSSPYVLLLGVFVLTAVLGQLISNMATALIVFPIAVQAAHDLDVSARPVLMTVTVAAAAVVRRIRNAIVERIRRWWPDVRAALVALRASHKLALLLVGSLATEVLFATALGLFARSFGYHLDLAELLVINISVSLLASFIPVPGGIGVAEFGLTIGLTSAGMTAEAAIAAVLLYRIATYYLPPAWGFPAMLWLQRNRYL